MKGLKAFSNYLQEFNDGCTHATLTMELGQLLQAVQDTGRAGSLTLVLKIAPAQKANSGHVDKVVINATTKLAPPKTDPPSDFFYLTDEGELTRLHPKQQSLELREAPKPAKTELKGA